MQDKFEQLFHEFEPQETTWGDWIHSPQAYFRGAKVFDGAQFNVGFQVFTGAGVLEVEPHFHRDEEYLVYLGAQWPDVFSSWDAEVWFYMGPTLDTMEKIVINAPTVIRIPKGFWHSPLDFHRIDKPMVFQAAVQAGKEGAVKFMERANGERHYIFSGDENRLCVFNDRKQCDYCGYCFSHPDEVPKRPYDPVKWTVLNEDTAVNGELIQSCICVLPKEETVSGDWCETPQAYFRGEASMPGATIHMGWQVIAKPITLENAHFHPIADQYLFFLGADPMNIFDFDAEIEFSVGADPDHLETRLITKPTVVRLPANTWHGPINFRRVGKPLMFEAAFMSGVWGAVERHFDADGIPVYVYVGDNVSTDPSVPKY